MTEIGNASLAIRTEEVIAAEINVIKASARVVLINSAIEIGQRLTEAKQLIPHGKWCEWLTENVDYTERTAQNLMAVYREYGGGKFGSKPLPEGLSYTQAIALLQLAPCEREELLEQNDVESMSVRRLQNEIAAYKEAHDEAQIKLDELLRRSNEDEHTITQMTAEISRLKDLAAETSEALKAAKADAEANAKAEDAEALAKKVLVLETERDTARDKLKSANKQLKELLNQAPVEPETIEVEKIVEVVPDAVARELEVLREVARKAPCASIIKFRGAYELMTAQIVKLTDLIKDIDAEAPEETAKYRAIVERVGKKLADAFAPVTGA